MNEIREKNGVIDEEYWSVDANNVLNTESAVSFLTPGLPPYQSFLHRWPSCTSLAKSTLPLSPTAVDIRANIGVSLPALERNAAAVMFLKFP